MPLHKSPAALPSGSVARRTQITCKNACVFVALLLCSLFGSQASAQQDEAAIVNFTASFRPGPFSALFVDPMDAGRIAVGTEDGHVMWSDDGLLSVHESQALLPRRYDPYTIRSGERAEFSSRSHTRGIESESTTPSSSSSGSSIPDFSSRDNGRKIEDPRTLLLFLHNLENGNPHPRWQMWMSINDPWTQISSIAMPGDKGTLAIASPAGILRSDSNSGAWHRTLGGPGPMAREKDLFGMAVAVDPVDSSHILAATDRGLMVSRDGGKNFLNHTDTGMLDLFVSKFIWSADVPNEVYAITADTIFASEDYGETFAPTFSAAAEIHDLALADQSGYIATKEGLQVLTPNGAITVLKNRDILGVAAWREGAALAITSRELFVVTSSGQFKKLLETTPSDPYLLLEGGVGGAWVMSRRNLLRVGPPVQRSIRARYRPPRLTMSQTEIEHAVLSHTGLNTPVETQLHQRWYAKLIPSLEVDIDGRFYREQFLTADGTFPVRFRHASSMENARVEWRVTANWDLSRFIFGDNNVVNPKLIIEQQIRDKRKQVMEEVSWHYREAAIMAWQLRRPPADPSLEFLWRSRLEELSSYLEFFSGKTLVKNNNMEFLE